MSQFNRLHCWVTLTLLGLFLAGALPGPAWGAEPVTIWAGSPTEKAVALTFDDGPSPVYTPQIMALFKQYQAHGTFFVMGHKVEQNPWLVQALLKDGHEVGNHSFSHPRMTKRTSSPGNGNWSAPPWTWTSWAAPGRKDCSGHLTALLTTG